MKQTDEISGWFNYKKTFDYLINTIPEGGSFAECGAWLGKSSSYLCDIVSATRPDITIYIVDTWLGSDSDITKNMAAESDIYRLFLENMGERKFIAIKKTSIEASKTFENLSLDVIFIDMDHSYEQVMQDLDHWYPKLKTNGYISGHDWSWPGVSSAVKKKFPNKQIIQSEGDCWIALPS